MSQRSKPGCVKDLLGATAQRLGIVCPCEECRKERGISGYGLRDTGTASDKPERRHDGKAAAAGERDE